MMSLLLFITMSGLIFSNIINHGCHPFNTETQLLYILLIPCTAIFYASMQEEENAKSIQSNKERLKTK